MERLSQFIMNHWLLWLVFIIVLALVFAYEFMSQKTKAKQITPQEAIALINDDKAIVIDLRDPEVFKKGRIIDSINASAEDFDKDKMNKYKNKTIILTCVRGLQSSTVAAKIRSQGYQPLILNGGITAWQNASLPLVKGKN